MQTLVDKGIINSEQLYDLLEKRGLGEVEFVLIDVREDSEYNMSHLKGVDMIKPSSSFTAWCEDVLAETKDKIVVFTCHTGSRSGEVQKIFKKKGHTATLNHVGGIATYRGPVER